MTKIDIVSGFLGAGKTTLIKKMVKEAYQGEKLVLIENEFGEISIDGGFLKDAGIQISEMSSGCICCSLVGDFGKALREVKEQFQPDRILIEPSGVGKLSDVIVAVENTVADIPDMKLNSFVTVADAGKVKVYMKNFGEFYNNQIETASTIILSRTDSINQFKLDTAVELLREHNQVASIVTTPWNDLTGQQLIEAMEGKASLASELAKLEQERLEEEDDDCCCHHHHDEDEDEHHHHDDEEHEHHHHHHDHDEHHHDHDEHCCCHDHDHEEHEHHHDHDEHCCHDHDHEHHHHHDEDCGCHDHEHHHHHHHADEVFTSWGVETSKKFDKATVEAALKALDTEKYGMILRAKGILPGVDGSWIHFDYVPEEANIRTGSADITGKLCVIGSKLDEAAIAGLFGV